MDGKISLIVVLICMEDIIANRFYELIPKPFFCKTLDAEIIYNYTCITKKLNRTMSLNSREIIFQPEVEVSNYSINIRIFRKVGKNYRQVMEIEQDMCDFTKDDSSIGSSILAKVLNKDGRRKYGNMFDPCPLKGRRYEKDAIIDYGRMPEVVPAGEYRVNITGYTLHDKVKRNFILTQVDAEVLTKNNRKSG